MFDMGPSQTAIKIKMILFCDSPEFLNDILALKAKGKEHPDVAEDVEIGSAIVASAPALAGAST